MNGREKVTEHNDWIRVKKNGWMDLSVAGMNVHESEKYEGFKCCRK